MTPFALRDKAQPSLTMLSVLVVAYNSRDSLAGCLNALGAQTFTDFEVILVDNASPQHEAQPAARSHEFVRLVENTENRGFAVAMNQAARLASGRWLVLLNPDAYPRVDWLAELVAASTRWPNVRCFTSRQLMAEDPTLLDGLGDVMSGPCIPYRGGYCSKDPGDTPEGEVFSPCGAAMMIDRALFLEMGGFDESFFCYCEDVDLGYRLQLAGEPTILAPKAVVLHLGSASSGGPASDFAVYHGTRNRFWVLLKDTPSLLLPIAATLHLIGLMLISTRREGARQAPTAWNAIWAAIREAGPVLRKRHDVQRRRKVSTLWIASRMTWNPVDLLQRRAVILKPRPSVLRPNRPGEP